MNTIHKSTDLPNHISSDQNDSARPPTNRQKINEANGDEKIQTDHLKNDSISEETKIKTALRLFLIILFIVMLFVLSRVGR